MVAEAPDKIEGNAYDTGAAQSQALNSSTNKYIPKARKPYIITKQREKWTDEEHQKFLEAVKLHGRAWRQIEEHVGTKTAIQIRSHAQKYFAKVERDPNSDSAEGSLNVFEIPPPRPKKKPLHPYPRKVVNPIKNGEMNAVSHPQDVTGVEKSPPTSAFSAIGSDTSGSPLISSRLSPTSCTTDDVLLMENDNECLTSNNTSVEEEKGSLELVQVINPSSAANNKLVMEAEMLTLGGPYSLDISPETEESSTTIKLFGRTLMVNESQKLSSSSTTKDNELKVQNFPKPDKDPKHAFGFIQGTFTGLSCFIPPQYGKNEEGSDAGVVSGGIPWWGWCQGMVFPQVSSVAAADSVEESPSCDKRDQETKPRKEGSPSSSNTSSELNELKTKTDDVESKAGSKTLKKRYAKKGFVPYKRCLTERDVTSPIVSMEEREGQRTRVCS